MYGMISASDSVLHKRHENLTSDFDDDEDKKSSKSPCKDQTKKQNHSEIEKRRRDKMNKYIVSLSSLIPMCKTMSRKIDKLTVLRMAVQHIKTIRGVISSHIECQYKPAFLTDEELKHLIAQSADGFLFVISCDRGRFLFLSDSVSQILNYSQQDLLGQSLFDILHPKDIVKVKEQLLSLDALPQEKFIDMKSILPVKEEDLQSHISLTSGSRRSFLCRMKCKSNFSIKEEGIHIQKKHKLMSSDRRYCVIHCTGYVKSYHSVNETENDGLNNTNLCCLIAVGRFHEKLNKSQPHIQNGSLRPVEFISRCSIDGKFIFVDQQAFSAIGYLPQELIGTSYYEYIHQSDVDFISECHREVLQSRQQITTQYYRFLSKDGIFVYLQSRWKSFFNPWTKEFEYIVSVTKLVQAPGFLVPQHAITSCTSSALGTLTSSKPAGDSVKSCEAQNIAGKIGRNIAEEAIEFQKRKCLTTLVGATNVVDKHKPIQIATLVNDGRNYNFTNTSQRQNVQNNSNISDLCVSSSRLPVATQSPDNEINNPVSRSEISHQSNDANDEAAMSVIMSLLEADAGLGGPVDFSGLPWPLP